MRIGRREFLGAATAVAVLRAKPLGMPIGCQTYPVRNEIGKDFAGTLAGLHADGMETIELCSPHSYKEFAPLARLTTAEMKKTIKDAGLRCESCHYNWRELKERLDERITYAKEIGLKQMVLSSFGLPATAKLADWSRVAEEFNPIAEKIHKAGMAAGFHNHNGEFQQLEGTLIYDELMKRFDAKLVGMQFQTAVISVGYQAATYFEKYPGRFLSIHAADWSAADKSQVALGKGEIDWKKLFAAAREAGVKNYFVEVEPDLMKQSIEFLKTFSV